MDDDEPLADTYTLIYIFLTKRSHTEAAVAVKKAAKDVVVLSDDLIQDGPALDEIIREWKDSEWKTTSTSTSTSSESESEPKTSKRVAKSSVPSCSACNKKKSKVNNSAPDAASKSRTNAKALASTSDSDSESDDSNDTLDTRSPKRVKCESSSDEDDGDMHISDGITKANTIKNAFVANVKKEESSDEFSSGYNSNLDEDEDGVKELHTKEKPKARESSSSHSDRQLPASKKRKASEDDNVVMASASQSMSRSTSAFSRDMTTPNESAQNDGNNGRKRPRKPSKKVDPMKASSAVVMDNRYEAKPAPANDYGQRAHRDLIATRGVGFRKEKNKKKRGSYRGGEISLDSHSFKFPD